MKNKKHAVFAGLWTRFPRTLPHCRPNYVAMAVKVNSDPRRKPNGVPEQGEQQSGRSDAGMVIVE
jgi:hypothetical protein